MYAIFLAVSGLWLVPIGPALSQQESDNVYPLLQRLELSHLQIVYLERELSNEKDASRASQTAAELAAALVKQLHAAESPEKTSPIVERLRSLLESHPEVRKPKLQAAILHAEFIRVERLCQSEFGELSGDAISQTQQRLRDLLVRVDDVQRQWSNNEGVVTNETNSPTATDDETRWRNARAREGLVKQLQFLAAWLHYYDGILSSDHDQQVVSWREANSGFRRLLEIPLEKPLTELESEWFELSAEPMSRIVLGLGMSEQALGNSASASYCFSLLHSPSVSATIRNRLELWRIHSFVFASQFGAAAQWMQAARNSGSDVLPPATELAIIAQQVAAKRISAATNSPEQIAFLNEVLLGLLEANELDLADQLLDSCAELLAAVTDPFYQRWLAGRRAFHRGQRSGRVADFKQAIADATAALQLAANQTRAAQTSQVRLMLAWSLLQSGQHDSAAREFRHVAWMTRTLDAEQSAQAAWSGIQALIQAPDAARNSRKIFNAIDELNRMHPGSSLLALANLERLRLQASWQNDLPSVDQLSAIESANPNYADAQLALCRIYYARCLADGVEALEADKQFLAIQEIVDRLSGDPQNTNGRATVKLLLLVADAALRFQPPKLEFAQTRISQAREIVEQNAWADPILADVQAIRFRWATLSKNTAVANELAQWLTDQAPSADLKMIGAIYLAEQIDRELASAPADVDVRERAYQLYRRLSEQFGNAPDDLRQS